MLDTRCWILDVGYSIYNGKDQFPYQGGTKGGVIDINLVKYYRKKHDL